MDLDAIHITDTHVYSILPVDRWPQAAALVADLVGEDAVIPSPDIASLLVARSLDTGEIDGVLFVQSALLVDRFACRPQVGVSYTAFHDLVRSILGHDTLYYTTVCDTPRAIEAAERAGLAVYEKLALPKSLIGSAASGEERGDGVVAGSDSGIDG